MSFLAPVMFWAAAVAVPALLLLYFLKLRRREEAVSSTFLWRRAVQDLQVNAPFQRLRKSLLLLLQLLILAAAIFALARPIVKTELTDQESLVLLIDQSASMNTIEEGASRLEIAKEQAKRLVKTLNKTGSSWLRFFGGADAQTRVMLIAFSDRARVIAPFTTNASELIQRIDGIEATDERSNVAEALQLAELYMTQTRLEQTPESAGRDSDILLYSDGNLSGADDVILRSGSVKLVTIGEAADNVGITALRVQRNYETPDLLNAFLQVQNFGPERVETDAAIYVDGVLHQVAALKLGPARPRESDAAPGEEGTSTATAALRFELQLPREAVLEARVGRDDALAVDNRAAVVVPPPRKMRALLVSAGNFFLESVLQNMPLERRDYVTPAQYAANADAVADGKSTYDVVIFDKNVPERLPTGNFMFIDALPPLEGIRATGSQTNHEMTWWDEAHPILRRVSLDNVFIGESTVLDLPREAQVLVEGPRGPLLAHYSREGSQYLILAFAIEKSDWWSHETFPSFIANAIQYLGGAGATGEAEPLRPGDALRITLPAGAASAVVAAPGGARTTVEPDLGGVARFATTSRAGIYTVEAGGEVVQRFAVNLEDAEESDVRPRPAEKIGGVKVTQGALIQSAMPEIWRWFAGAALLLLLVEWYIYNRRVMI